jgi:hypothetical protein
MWAKGWHVLIWIANPQERPILVYSCEMSAIAFNIEGDQSSRVFERQGFSPGGVPREVVRLQFCLRFHFFATYAQTQKLRGIEFVLALRTDEYLDRLADMPGLLYIYISQLRRITSWPKPWGPGGITCPTSGAWLV